MDDVEDMVELLILIVLMSFIELRVLLKGVFLFERRFLLDISLVREYWPGWLSHHVFKSLASL